MSDLLVLFKFCYIFLVIILLCIVLSAVFECCKTKTKVITVASRNRRRRSNEPIRNRSKYMQLAWEKCEKVWENACAQVTNGFGSAFDWLRK